MLLETLLHFYDSLPAEKFLKKLSNSSKFETNINKKIIDQLSQCNSSYVLEVYTFILILDMSYTSVHIVSHSLKWNFHSVYN